MKKKLVFVILFCLTVLLSACGTKEENLNNENQITEIEQSEIEIEQEETNNIEEQDVEVEKGNVNTEEESKEVISESTSKQNDQENIRFVLNEDEILTFRTTATVNV